MKETSRKSAKSAKSVKSAKGAKGATRSAKSGNGSENRGNGSANNGTRSDGDKRATHSARDMPGVGPTPRTRGTPSADGAARTLNERSRRRGRGQRTGAGGLATRPPWTDGDGPYPLELLAAMGC